MAEDILVPIMIVGMLFVALPWLVFHYITKWKTAKTLTTDDEKLLDDLYEAGRRLEDRLCTIERIMTAENPDWRRDCVSSPTLSEDTRLLEEFKTLDREEESVFSRRER